MLDHNANLPKEYLPTADQVAVWIDDAPARVVRYQHFDEPLYFVHVAVDAEAEHEARVCIKRVHNTVRIHPARLGIEPTKAEKGYRFEFTGAPYLVIECDGLGYLCLAFEPCREEPEGEEVLHANDAGLRPDPVALQTEAIQAALDRVAGSDRLSTLRLPAGLYRSGDLHLRSNCRLHLESGAVLLASDRAADLGDPSLPGHDGRRARFINAMDGENISITGPGHIDGNRRALDLDGYFKGMVLVARCRRVRIDGPVFSDAPGWNTTLRDSEDCEVRRLKILNNRPRIKCINTDGCNPDGSRTVLIEQSLMHTGDDAVAVKSTTYDGQATAVADVTVRDLLAINNSATAKIGTETVAGVMERIHFERIDAVRTNRLVVIDAFDHACIRDVSFVDCHLAHHDAGWYPGYLIDLRAPLKAFREIPAKATVRGVRLERIGCDCETQTRFLNRQDPDGLAITGVEARAITSRGHPLELMETRAEAGGVQR